MNYPWIRPRSASLQPNKYNEPSNMTTVRTITRSYTNMTLISFVKQRLYN